MLAYIGLAALDQVLVQMAQARELAGILGGWRRLQFSAGTEIAAAKQVGRGDNSGPHGTVFVGALRPSQTVVNPQIEAHSLLMLPLRIGDQLPNRVEQLPRPERLA